MENIDPAAVRSCFSTTVGRGAADCDRAEARSYVGGGESIIRKMAIYSPVIYLSSQKTWTYGTGLIPRVTQTPGKGQGGSKNFVKLSNSIKVKLIFRYTTRRRRIML